MPRSTLAGRRLGSLRFFNRAELRGGFDMTLLDAVVAVIPLLITVGGGMWLSRRRAGSSNDFILAGRTLSWWQAGTAMLAGASNADSPLHHSGKIRRDGLTGVWFYWSQIIGHLFGAIVLARLWRRSGLTTVVEFYGLRYAGGAGAIGKMCSMILGTFVESVFGIALGLAAMAKLGQFLFGAAATLQFGPLQIGYGVFIALGSLLIVALYSVVAGLFGIVIGAVIEYCIALACSYVVLFFVYREVGFGSGLESGLRKMELLERMNLSPQWGFSLFVFFLILPLATCSGMNSINQRYLALRDERQSTLAGVWRVMNHYFIRCWPWHLCGLCSLVLLGAAAMDDEMAYPSLIVRYVPRGMQGVIFSSLVLAFMGTASTAMHTSGSVFVNDFYRPTLVPNASDRHYLWAIRGAMALCALAAAFVALWSHSILTLLQLYFKVASAAGIILLLRWFWWRINGWADIAAQLLALPVALLYEYGGEIFGPERDPVALVAQLWGAHSPDDRFAVSFLLTVGTTTFCALIVMLLTSPEPMPKLEEFYRRIRPYGYWGPIATRCPDVIVADRLSRDLAAYGLAMGLCGGIVSSGVALSFGQGAFALGSLGAAGICGWLLLRVFRRH